MAPGVWLYQFTGDSLARELKVGDKLKVTYNNNVYARLKPAGEAAVDAAQWPPTWEKKRGPGARWRWCGR